MPHEAGPTADSNVYILDPARLRPQPSGADMSRTEEMRAIAVCLEYLYGEVVRLNAPISAHLIGAAAESLRQEVHHVEHGEG